MYAKRMVDICATLARGIRTQAYIGGEWIGSDKCFEVTSPVTGKVLASVPDLDETHTQRAICAASNAFPAWSALSPRERSRNLRTWFDRVNARSQELSEILSSEAGKPIDEAKGEVVYGNSFLEWFSEEAVRAYGEVLPGLAGGKTVVHMKEPCGVAGIITPWNFPVAMITRKVGAALAAGCTVVCKPAEDTPLSALALADIAEEAGIPPGVFNVVTCSRKHAAAVGKMICHHPNVPVISFTGSTEVGKHLFAECSSGVKRVCLELGGNAPFIVFPSADINAAVSGLLFSKFRNSGQTCISPNRILIHKDVVSEFTSKLAAAMKDKFYDSTGHMKPNILSPMINQPQLNKVTGLVNEALDNGAKAELGGKAASNLGPLFYEPTLLTGVTPSMACYCQEVFGPVISIVPFSTEEEAIKLANSTERGLAAYFYSRDVGQVMRLSRNIQAGMIGANDTAISGPEAAFGGVKESGLGREGSHYGLEEYLNIKYVCLGSLQ